MSPSDALFRVEGYDVTVRRRGASPARSRATVILDLHQNVCTFTAEGTGPVHALDRALRGCLASLYPEVDLVSLRDYRVNVLDRNHGTDAQVCVAIEWTDGHSSWTTDGVSENVIEATWIALVKSIRRELGSGVNAVGATAAWAEDQSWAV